MSDSEVDRNPFAIVNVVLVRARQLENGAPAFVRTTHTENPVTTAIREVRHGLEWTVVKPPQEGT